MNTMRESKHPTRLQLAAAFLCVYLVWGSTYLGIRIAVTTIPPFLMAATRFLIAGGALFIWARVRGAPKASREEWKNAGIIGGLLLLIGNGAVAWSEQRVSSGLTSLLVATTPVWLALIEVRAGRRPSALQWLGIAIGLVGVGLLVMPTDGSSAAISPVGAVVITIGTLSWAVGSMFSRSAKLATPASLSSGMQMLCGGTMLLIASALTGEFQRVKPSAITGASIFALAYLIVFGSLIAFSTYMWLLKAASPAAVGTYSYVNPVVAVMLGVFVGGETLPPLAVVAMVVIVGSVALVSLAPYLRRARVKEA
jgi:drug/metabolite transporter (DMT)-like permease